MKYLRLVIVATSLFATSFAMTACNQHTHDSHQQEQQQGKEYTAAYVCPMHCTGSGSEEPGKCPACGMDYVANEEQEQ
ncbi:MAG: heavy metal-binding domain-containing protein [Saprospiraceae bacterium]